MHAPLVRFVSRMLIICMIGLPFQPQAGMIGTGEAVSAAQARAARDKLAGFIERTEVAARLQALGLTPQAAKERVAALTDSEVARFAGRIDELPAAAFGGPGLGMLIVVIFLIYIVFVGPEQKGYKEPAKPAAKEPAKPAAK